MSGRRSWNWGDGPVEDSFTSKRAAVAFSASVLTAVMVAASAFLPEAWGRLGLLLVVVGIGPSILLGYLAVWECRDGRVAGYGLAAAGLLLAYCLLAYWYFILGPAMMREAQLLVQPTTLGTWLLAAAMVGHVVFLLRGQPLKSLLIGAPVAVMLLAVFAVWLQQSIEDSRRLQTMENLRELGIAIQQRSTTHGETPMTSLIPWESAEEQAVDTPWSQQLLPFLNPSPEGTSTIWMSERGADDTFEFGSWHSDVPSLWRLPGSPDAVEPDSADPDSPRAKPSTDYWKGGGGVNPYRALIPPQKKQPAAKKDAAGE